MILGEHSKTVVPLLLAMGMTLLSGATSALAAEPILQLTTLAPDAAAGHTLQPVRLTAAVSLRTQSTTGPSTAVNTNRESAQLVTSVTNAPAVSAPEPLLRSVLVPETYESEEADRQGLLASARFQAGLGQIFPDRSDVIYGRNGTKLEEPSCGYLKVTIRF